PNGRVLIGPGQTTGAASTASCDFFDPALGAFAPAPAAPIAAAFYGSSLLPSNRVLQASGLFNPSGGSSLFDEGRGATPTAIPTLSGITVTSFPGGTLLATGTLFAGLGSGGGDATPLSSSAYPLLLLIRDQSEQSAYASFTTFNATSAS